MGRNVRRTKRLIKRRINSAKKRFTKSRIKISNRKSKIKVSKKRLTKRRMKVSKRKNKQKMKGGMDAAPAIRGKLPRTLDAVLGDQRPLQPFRIEGFGDPAYDIVTGSINEVINKPIILLILISFIIIYNHKVYSSFNKGSFERLLNAMGIHSDNYKRYYELVYQFIDGKDADEFIKAIYYFIDYFTLYYICLGLNRGNSTIIDTFAEKFGAAYSKFISAATEFPGSPHNFNFSPGNFIRIGRILGEIEWGCPDFLIMYDRNTHNFVSTAQRESGRGGLFSGYYPNYYPQFNEHYIELLIIDADIYREIFTKIPELIRLMVAWNEALRRRQKKSAPNPTDSIFPSLVNSTPEVIQARSVSGETPGKNRDALSGSTLNRSGSTQKRSPSSALVGSPDIGMTSRQILHPAVPQQPSNTSSQRKAAKTATKNSLAQRAEQRAAQFAAQRAKRRADAQEESARQRALVQGDGKLPSIPAPQIQIPA